MRTFLALLSVPLVALNTASHGCVSWRGFTTEVEAPKHDGHVKGEGEVVKRPLTVPEFHGIELEGAMDVVITPSEARSVVVEAQANIAELVTTEVTEGIWHIQTEGQGYSTDKPFVVHISMPTVDHITIDGSGDVKGTGPFRTDKLVLRTNGSGDMTFEVQAGAVDVAIGGSGDMKLSGTSDDVAVSIKGSGDVNARALKTSGAVVSISGSGDVTVNTDQRLVASISGSGNVMYDGSPSDLTRNVSGSGEIRPVQHRSSGRL